MTIHHLRRCEQRLDARLLPRLLLWRR